MQVIHAWKKIGETPLHTLERARRDYGIKTGVQSCYTCRLDPMAQGIITLLYGEARHLSAVYNHASKTYVFQAILGASTDSYDAMGCITQALEVTGEQAQLFTDTLLSKIGDGLEQALPAYSSYRYKGKPLWVHARDGTLPEVMPTRPVNVHSMELVTPFVQIPIHKYRAEVYDDILDVRALSPDSFRYPEILSGWKGAIIPHVYRITLRVSVSSGTYVRSLVHDVGQELGIPAHAFRITRTRISTC